MVIVKSIINSNGNNLLSVVVIYVLFIHFHYI